MLSLQIYFAKVNRVRFLVSLKALRIYHWVLLVLTELMKVAVATVSGTYLTAGCHN